MSLNLFHVKLQKVIQLIDEGNFPEAIVQIENHLSGEDHDASFEEKQFMQLMIFIEYYQNALKNAVANLEQKDSEKAKEMVNKAIKKGKDIVYFCENIIAVLKKKEINAL